jgi:ribosomal protein S18 acetylase RimI-like enzyme
VDLGRDALLMEIDGALAGYAIVHRPGAFAVVAPEYEGRGVGARLLEWVEQREREREGDGRALHALDAVSFASSPDHVPESYAMFVQEHLHAHDVAPELSLVARDGTEIVGFLLARRWQHEGSGYVDLLAVAPGHQRRGIGAALLTHGFAAFASAGLVQAQLGVASDNPRGLRVYEAAGMGPRFRFDVFERRLE